MRKRTKLQIRKTTRPLKRARGSLWPILKLQPPQPAEEIRQSQEEKVLPSQELEVSDLMSDLILEVDSFSGGCIKSHFHKWEKLDQEVLETVQGLHINLTDTLPSSPGFQYSFGEEEEKFIIKEIDRLINKSIIQVPHHEADEFVSPIFVRP